MRQEIPYSERPWTVDPKGQVLLEKTIVKALTIVKAIFFLFCNPGNSAILGYLRHMYVVYFFSLFTFFL